MNFQETGEKYHTCGEDTGKLASENVKKDTYFLSPAKDEM